MQTIMGKVVAGVIGFLTLGVVGLLFGLAIGHAFDRGLWQALKAASPEALASMQKQFFETTFILLGYVAKADGRVSEAEIHQAEVFFRQLRLSPAQRDQAIGHFKRGTQEGFDPAGTVADFADKVGPRRQLHNTLFAFLATMALADGDLQQPERDALHRIATLLGVSPQEIDHLLSMLSAQARFHYRYSSSGQQQSHYTQTPPRDRLADAYQALGLTADCSDADLKKAYRKLMSENHPDKLMAKGVPDDLLKLATERSQDISNAYEVIKTSRGL